MPDLGVLVFVEANGLILLTKREDLHVWCLPGGAVDDGESIAQAAIREAREETGLDVELVRLVGLYSHPSWNTHQALFAARPIGGALSPQLGEVVEVGYFNPEALPIPLLPWNRQPIRDALAGAGGSTVWLQPIARPFGPDVTRRDIYALRDRSGLSRSEFFARHFSLDRVGADRKEI